MSSPSCPCCSRARTSVGAFLFALSGAVLAVRRELDVVGVAVLAIVAGAGGGLLRDVLTGAVPPRLFTEPGPLAAALLATLAGFFGAGVLERLRKPVVLLDAAGLSLFAVTGTIAALEAGLPGVSAALLGVLTAVGGGALRDVLAGQVPVVLRGEVYALAALAGALVVAALPTTGGWRPPPRARRSPGRSAPPRCAGCRWPAGTPARSPGSGRGPAGSARSPRPTATAPRRRRTGRRRSRRR